MNRKHLQLLLHLPKIKIPIPGHRDLIGKIVIDEIQVIISTSGFKVYIGSQNLDFFQ